MCSFPFIYYVSSDPVVEFIVGDSQNIAYVYIKNRKFTMYIYTLMNSGLMEMVFIYLLKCIFCKKKFKNNNNKKKKINLSLLDQNLRLFLFINKCSAARLDFLPYLRKRGDPGWEEKA